MDYLDMDITLCMNFNYNPAIGKYDFLDVHIDRENYNIEPPMPECFKDHHICYAIHELFDHECWSLQDIARINNIEIKVEITHTESLGMF